MISLGWDFWTARLSKLETRRERGRLSISTPPKETSNEHRVASNRSRGRAYGFAPRRRSPFQIVGASGMGQDERLRRSTESRSVRPAGHEWRQCQVPDGRIDQGHWRIEASLEDSRNSVPLRSLPCSIGCQFKKRPPSRSGRRREVDRERSVLDMGADSEPTADSGAC